MTLLEESADLLRSLEVPLTPVTVSVRGQSKAWLPLDLDVSPFDNSTTKKEGVSRTYKGVDGYAPFFAYLGQEGYGVNVNLREGSMHVQKEAAAYLQQSLEYSRHITADPLLVRMDAGNDAIENLNVCLEAEVDFIIKRNLRRESPESWLAIAKQDGICCEERDGKRVYLGSMVWEDKKLLRPIRVVYQVIERTMEADGQLLLTPPDAPVKTKVTRRRVRTVIENLIWLASRMVKHARETKLHP